MHVREGWGCRQRFFFLFLCISFFVVMSLLHSCYASVPFSVLLLPPSRSSLYLCPLSSVLAFSLSLSISISITISFSLSLSLSCSHSLPLSFPPSLPPPTLSLSLSHYNRSSTTTNALLPQINTKPEAIQVALSPRNTKHPNFFATAANSRCLVHTVATT